jgi:lysyl-tRNA synthetase class 2
VPERQPPPKRFPDRDEIAAVRALAEPLGAGAEAETRCRIAGRAMARRGMGKLVFLDVVDRSGRIQVICDVAVTGELDIHVGDVVGVAGRPAKSRRGEASVLAESVEVLSRNTQPLPDTFHGLTDVELRYRKRYLDLLMNEETREVFITRARAITAVRRALDEAGFVEVETPVLQPRYGGAFARPFVTHHNELDADLFLRIATELYLKRLIVGGLERVYEIGKDFRNEGLSPKHNPEFTMLEWYEAYADWEVVADRAERLIRTVGQVVGSERFQRKWERETLAGAIAARLDGLDVLANRSLESLQGAMRERGLEIPDEPNWAALVDHLVSKHVEPTLIEPTMLHDYPVELSPFAKRHREHDGLVERFEAFAEGMEFCNAFSELNDPDDQRARFEEQVRHAAAGDENAPPFDHDYIYALEHGMPPTGGIGIGIDRLVMLLTGQRTIREVVLFPALK